MAGLMTWICLLFFILFAMYFYMYQQRDVIALVHFIKSQGDTAQYRFIPALLGMFLSLLPSFILLKLLHFSLKMKAAAFLPSYVLLGLISSTSPAAGSNVLHTPMFQAIVMIVISALIIIVAVTRYSDSSEHGQFQKYLYTNVLITCLGLLFTIDLSANDRLLHSQLQTERLASQGDWKGVLSSANDPTCQNRNITAMHVLALSKQGILADELFTVPGLESSQSLLPDTTEAVRLYGADSIVYCWLGAVPARDSHLTVHRFLEKALQRRLKQRQDTLYTQHESIRTKVLADYYLCSLLLDRRLNEFVSQLPRFYHINDSLPRHYREAYVMYQRRAKNIDKPLLDEATTESYQDFLKIMSENKHNKNQQRKACLDMYDGTYWVWSRWTL